MNTKSTIIKGLILPLLLKSTQVDFARVPDTFWEQFARDLIHYEIDATPIFASLYKLELQNPEDVFEKLSEVYSSFIKELAEEYVLDNQSELTTKLLESKNETFLQEVSFLKTMKAVITKVERQELKKNVPLLYNRLVFELDEETLRQVAKKKTREDLRNKFNKWDEELVEESAELLTANHSEPKLTYNRYQYAIPRSKVISLSWMKYAVAASIIIAVGLFYFKNTDSGIVPVENRVVTTEERESVIEPQIDGHPIDEIIALAEIETSSRTMNVLEPSSLGFTTSDKKTKHTVSFKDATQRILSLKKFLEKNKVSSTVDPKILDKYKVELADLNKRKEKYIFDGKTLTLFSKYDSQQYTILSTEDKQYFLKKGTIFYDFKVSKKPMSLEKVTNVTSLEALEKIEFENE